MSSELAYPDTVILLPVFRPGPHLGELVGDLIADGVAAPRIVVVDDGSGPGGEPALAAVRGLGCPVLRHPVNRGKGAALKTGFRYARGAHPGLDVVSADADGQHRAADIRLVAERAGAGRIVLGVRRFDAMPPRSRLGNEVTRVLFRAVTGRYVSDTQTGLRAYPAELLDHLGEVEGERFEYEMNVLLDAAGAGRPLEEVVVPTTYLDGNAASHFGGVTDSLRVYRPLLRFAVAGRPAASLTGR
ncbi:glycosyltransferase family 2 protein [Actinoplanes sp. NEAU-A12]|uniref:Glycosyltransferase family 2 protein n=1 Tax=Actinoplanes sandaracinus TaxID=3045177 RepID=A0ABT6WIP7_9ACTN|nr:glycosyltransferase family 2 protein [Actinoplanes sandaracinus]MDI6099599.1 glycosyltransferase family 2 protein [Actinoplanes sandaracinus]